MDDFYSPVAEFYDLVTQAHSAGEQVLRERLTAMTLEDAPILDIGAGTGRTVAAIADALPDSDILAIEPSPAMRAVLTHRVARDPRLRKRVTIIPEPVEKLLLPERLSAVVAYGVLGHLSREARLSLWKTLLPRLPAGAPIFIELLPVEKPVSLPAFSLANATLGQRHYSATLQGEPGEDDTMMLTSTWVVRGGPSPTQVIHNRSVWHTFGLDDLARETGLKAERLTPQAGVLYV
ncbi:MULTISPECIES: class I SAM-dependent methyltransferase [Enterobacterales]|uniref:class I SAM-dependent methyltransferase n=1 Tax=Enterobacterales TaxID=91347 RepID=UPI002ED915FC